MHIDLTRLCLNNMSSEFYLYGKNKGRTPAHFCALFSKEVETFKAVFDVCSDAEILSQAI